MFWYELGFYRIKIAFRQGKRPKPYLPYGKRRLTRYEPIWNGKNQRDSKTLRLLLFHDIALYIVADFYIVELLDRDTAFVALLNFLNVVFKAFEL